jgi:hypothetical protein
VIIGITRSGHRCGDCPLVVSATSVAEFRYVENEVVVSDTIRFSTLIEAMKVKKFHDSNVRVQRAWLPMTNATAALRNMTTALKYKIPRSSFSVAFPAQ